MTDDLVTKRQQGAQQFMGILDRLGVAVGEAVQLAAEFNAAGIVFVDSDFVGPEGDVIGHLDAALMNEALALFDYKNPMSLVSYMTSPASSSQSSPQETIDRIRP